MNEQSHSPEPDDTAGHIRREDDQNDDTQGHYRY